MSNTPRPIVIGIDHTPESQTALRWAVDAAARRDAPVRIVRVVSSQLPPLTAELRPAVQTEEAKKPLTDAVSYARERLGASKVSQVFTSGPPAGILIDESADAQLLVVGSRVRSTLPAIMMGSVSSAVAAHAKCPVVVVRETDDDSTKPIMVGVDGSTQSENALAFAFAEADMRGLPVDVVHCWDEMDHVDPGVWIRTPGAELRQKVNDWLIGVTDEWRTKYPDVKVREHLLDGGAGYTLAERSPDPSMIVVGSRGHGGIAGLLLGSVSQSLLHHARCTVAVVR